MTSPVRELTVVVGAGGVGKTTYAASRALDAAASGARVLVMTFDPSRRLKDSLGVGDGAAERPVAVPLDADGTLEVSLLDARRTFDRLVRQYAPDAAAQRRILENPYYDRLSGSLAGILEYMGVETLYEAREEGRWDRIVLDTPPTSQALDFLEAPNRIVSFLDSGAATWVGREWFDDDGRLRLARVLPFVGRALERKLEGWIGLGLARDVSEFFSAFKPLYEGFRERALAVRELLASDATGFHLVAGPQSSRLPESLFFARRLEAEGYALDRIVVNRSISTGLTGPEDDAHLAWFRERARRHGKGWEAWRARLPDDPRLIRLPELPIEPATLPDLHAMVRQILRADRGEPLPTFESLI